MMTLLGQHGQKQDYAKGVHLIRLAAQNADENAPQGAYVSILLPLTSRCSSDLAIGLWHVAGSGTSRDRYPRAIFAP
jgi:hypothetical protein